MPTPRALPEDVMFKVEVVMVVAEPMFITALLM